MDILKLGGATNEVPLQFVQKFASSSSPGMNVVMSWTPPNQTMTNQEEKGRKKF